MPAPVLFQCRGTILGTGCIRDVMDGGVDSSYFCTDCYTKDRVDKFAQYRDMRDEGYGRHEALVKLGLRDPAY